MSGLSCGCVRPMTTPGLSGLAETAFSARIGTAPTYADSLDEAVQLVYVRANYNANKNANSGSLPLIPKEYYSKKLVSAIIEKYRNLSGTGVVPHLTDLTISTPTATDIYDQVTSHLRQSYPAITADVSRAILREFFYAVVDKIISAELLLPAVSRYPTAGAQAMLALEEQRRQNKEDAEANAKDTFFGRIGAGFINLFSAPGELASAATTTAKIVGIAVPVCVVTIIGGIVYVFVSKGRQLDVNSAFREQQKTIREVGPEVAAVAMQRGGAGRMRQLGDKKKRRKS